MKKLFFLIIVGLFAVTSVASASSISYAIINSAGATSTSVSISTILKRSTYTCDTTSYVCTLTKEATSTPVEPPLVQVTLDALKAKEGATSTPGTPYTPPTPQPQVYGVFTLPYNAVSVTSSLDGKKIAYYVTQPGTVKTYNSYRLSFDSGKTLEKFNVMGNWDIVTDNTNLFGFTDDSNTLIYLDDRSGYQQLYAVDLTKDQKNLLGEPLVTKKYTVFDFVVKGDTVYFIANRAGVYTWGLFALDIKTKKLTEIYTPVMYTNNLVFSGNNLLFTIEKEGQGILRAYNIDTKEIKEFSGIPQDTVPVLPYTLLMKKGIKGSLIEPPKGIVKNKKAIIWLHGGPYRQSSPQRHSYGSYATYDWMLDEMVKEGTVVLKLDYPGSMGFGKAYSEDIVRHIGVSDVAYLKKAIAYLKQKGIKDVYLFGNSYGGYLSLKGAVELNGSISGAIAAAPVTDWKLLIERVSPTPFEAHFDGVPQAKNEALYKASSVVGSLSKLTKPILLFHGNLDKQVPFSQSDYLFKVMTEQNKDVTYYSVQNQAHIYNGVSQNQAICQKIASFIGVSSTSTTFCMLQ
jgi:dipeptidyl aminopeptidase/acylaminoacyl peptidase